MKKAIARSSARPRARARSASSTRRSSPSARSGERSTASPRPARRSAYFPVDITDDKAVADLLHQVRVEVRPGHRGRPRRGRAGRQADRGPDRRAVRPRLLDEGGRAANLLDLLGTRGAEGARAVQLDDRAVRPRRPAAYACANEVLNKTAQVEARRRPACRVVSINWGPWDGGMVTPALRKLFETEGVGLIPLLDGAVFLVQELNAAGKAVEVIAHAAGRAAGRGSIADAGRSGRQHAAPRGVAGHRLGRGRPTPSGRPRRWRSSARWTSPRTRS